MAVRTLLSLVGSQHELGDIIHTKRTSMADGRALIPCDGKLITPASRPLLEAVLPAGAHLGTGVILNSSAVFNRAEKFIASQTNGRTLGLSLEAIPQMAYDDGTTTSDDALSVITSGAGLGISDDGSKSIVVGVNASLDLVSQYNDASAKPTTTANVDLSAPNYDAGTADCVMSADGEIIVAYCQDTSDDLRFHKTTDGADGTWSSVVTINPTVSGTRVPQGRAVATATCGHILFGTTKGMWYSTDTGASWTQDIKTPSGDDPFLFVLNAAGTSIYAIDNAQANRVYKSTDSGASWTVVFEQGQEYKGQPPFTSMSILSGLGIDSSDNLYVVSYHLPHAASVEHQSFTFYYSSDDGVTWSHVTKYFLTRETTAGTNVIPTATSGMLINDAGTQMSYKYNVGTDADFLFEFVITQGKFPPHILELDMKMVAD